MSRRIVDTFAGPGGWDEGMRMLGLTDVIGIEWDTAACATAEAAGHRRIQADVAALDPLGWPCWGKVSSPPCQAWSTAGKRKGELDRANCHLLADRMAGGDDSTDWCTWEDPRSALVCQPVRWVRELRPEWVALEEVPAVAGLWEHFARIFRGWGYSVWTGDLCAADYGVPQTRTRRILTASRVRTVGPPPPTHSETAHGDDLLGGHTLPWVTMAEALGWAEADAIRPNRGSGFVERHGDRPDFPATRPAPVVISKSRSWERIVTNQRTSQTGEYYERSTDEPAPTLTTNARLWSFAPRPGERPPVYVNGNQENAARRSADEPAPTVLFGHRSNDVRWALDRPATTAVGSFRPDVIAGPGHHDTSRQDAPGSVRVTVQEAAILQSFRPDYEWSGSRTKQYEQCGNAIPPRLAAHVVASAIGIDPTAAIDRYYAEALGGAA